MSLKAVKQIPEKIFHDLKWYVQALYHAKTNPQHHFTAAIGFGVILTGGLVPFFFDEPVDKNDDTCGAGSYKFKGKAFDFMRIACGNHDRAYIKMKKKRK